MQTRRMFISVMLTLPVLTGTLAAAEELPDKERLRIEALLTHLGDLRDSAFIRNGKEYDAATAVRFLRGKWDAHRDAIHSAEQFIAVAATRSSSTGREYRIRIGGHPPQPCADYLTARLREMAK